MSERRLPALRVPQLLVDNVRYTMAQVARRFYGDPAAHMTLVGITGTNGKTSRSDLRACFQEICMRLPCLQSLHS